MDFTQTWVTFTRYKGQLGLLVAGIMLFAAGWQLGRVMSPYYAAHSIVFTEVAANDAGNPLALQQLREQGLAKASPIPTVNTPQVAGVVAVATATPTVTLTATDAAAKTYVGSINSDKYHHRDCAAANQIKEENKVWFATPQDAEAAGYTASKCTQDRLKQ